MLTPLRRVCSSFLLKRHRESDTDTQFCGCLYGFADGLNTLVMAEDPLPAPAVGPPSVAVHNDSNMPWQPVRIYLILKSQCYLFLFLSFPISAKAGQPASLLYIFQVTEIPMKLYQSLL